MQEIDDAWWPCLFLADVGYPVPDDDHAFPRLESPCLAIASEEKIYTLVVDAFDASGDGLVRELSISPQNQPRYPLSSRQAITGSEMG